MMTLEQIKNAAGNIYAIIFIFDTEATAWHSIKATGVCGSLAHGKRYAIIKGHLSHHKADAVAIMPATGEIVYAYLLA